MPSLRVILCLSKNLDYGPGYEPFAAREFVRRKEAVEKLLGRNKLFTVDSSLAAGLDSGTVFHRPEDGVFRSFDHSLPPMLRSALSLRASRWVLDDRKAAKQFQIRGGRRRRRYAVERVRR